MAETIICSNCKAQVRTDMGFVRCPECSKPLSDNEQAESRASLAGTMHGLLKRYEGQNIGINFDSPTGIKGAMLVRANEDYFSVRANGVLIHFPYRHVLNVKESKTGIAPTDLSANVFNLVIVVYHLVVYRGAVGISLPLDI